MWQSLLTLKGTEELQYNFEQSSSHGTSPCSVSSMCPPQTCSSGTFPVLTHALFTIRII